MRDQIIEAAEEVFASEGPEGLSMRRLAEKIDYSPAAIYKYFGSKDELVQEIREQFFERLLLRLDQAPYKDLCTPDAFKLCLRVYIDCGLERPNHYRMAFQAHEEEEAVAEDSKTFEAAMMLEQMIKAGIDGGLFRAMDEHLAAKSVWAALHGLTLLMVEIDQFPSGMTGSEHLTRDAVIDFHADMLVRGLCRS